MDKNLACALLKAQGTMGKLIKDSTNPHFRNTYASLTAVLDTVRGPLTEAGLVLYQSASAADGMVMVRSMLIHAETGESIEEMLPLPVAQPTPQAMGSAITYGRRYLAMAMCGLSPDDDDGEAGSHAAKPAAVKQSPVKNVSRETLSPSAKADAMHRQPVHVSRETILEDGKGNVDVDFGMGERWEDIPSVVEQENAQIDYAIGLLHSDQPLSELAVKLMTKCRELDKQSGDKALSTTNKDGSGAGQYGLLAGKIDAITGKGSHKAVLSALVGYGVDKESPPGWKVKELIDWLSDDKGKASTEKAIRDVWAALQAVTA